MTKKLQFTFGLLIVASILLGLGIKYACNKFEEEPTSSAIRTQLKGIWTDDNAGNATFEISNDSIYYLDQNANYAYRLHKNHIAIHYPDYIYNAAISFQHDTLIMDSKKFGKAVFWRFDR